MFVAKDKSGHVCISVERPVRERAYWRPINCRYIIMNNKYAEELFPNLKWEDEPIELTEKIF